MGISQLLFFKAPTFSQVTADNGSGAKEDAGAGWIGWLKSKGQVAEDPAPASIFCHRFFSIQIQANKYIDKLTNTHIYIYIYKLSLLWGSRIFQQYTHGFIFLRSFISFSDPSGSFGMTHLPICFRSPSSEILGGTLPGSDEDEEEKQVPEGSPETSAAGWRGCFLGPEDRFSEGWWLKNLLLLWSWLSHDHHRSTQTSYYSHPWDDESTSQICCRFYRKKLFLVKFSICWAATPSHFFIAETQVLLVLIPNFCVESPKWVRLETHVFTRTCYPLVIQHI